MIKLKDKKHKYIINSTPAINYSTPTKMNYSVSIKYCKRPVSTNTYAKRSILGIRCVKPKK